MTFDPHRVNAEAGELEDDLKELLAEWNTREYHLGEAQNERRKELEKCRRELAALLDEEDRDE